MIIIIDYGMGNLGSLVNMLKKIHVPAKVSTNIEDIESAEKLILPGVGSFDHGMQQLQKFQFIDILNKKVMADHTPILGICLGMQIFAKKSEEGIMEGLGWFDAQSIQFHFENSNTLKIPHMGWDNITIVKENPIYQNLDINSMFYFVHSYHVVCNQKQDVLSTSHYGYEFVSSIAKDNIIGMQFHPEKSHRYGMNVLKNFCSD